MNNVSCRRDINEILLKTAQTQFNQSIHFTAKLFPSVMVINLRLLTRIRSLPKDKTLDWAKFKAFTDIKINAT